MATDVRTRTLRAIVGLGVPALIAVGLFLWYPPRLYGWMKALHLIAVIAWVAGMVQLVQVFAFHTQAEPRQSETFKLIEQRLLAIIINPAIVLSWAIGGWLIWAGEWLSAGWLHVKLVLVLALSWLHGLLSSWTRRFAADQNRHGEKFYRIVNALTIILVAAVIILAVVKPL